MKVAQRLDRAANALLEFDHRAQLLFKPLAGSPAVRALDVLSKIADQPELRTIAGGLILAGIFSTNDRMVRAGSRMLIAHEAATVIKDGLKLNIDRTRPRSAKSKKAKKPRKGNHVGKELSSFPSGHSAGAVAAARAFSREYPEHSAIALSAAGLAALSQIPRCAHYPTDVAAGIAIGLAAEEAVNVAWDFAKVEERGALEDG
jgi:membrane-associated phospholipid phosphatase